MERNKRLWAALAAVWALTAALTWGDVSARLALWAREGGLARLSLLLTVGPGVTMVTDEPDLRAELVTPVPTRRPEERSPAAGPVPEVKNTTSCEIDPPALLREPLTQRLSADGAQILIIHTHSTEAYTPAPGEEYIPTDPYRTVDESRSVIAVGDALQNALERQGLRVLHDRSLYDYPDYNGAYARSGAAVEAALSEHPTISVVIDVHRDALGSASQPGKTLSRLEGERTAQVMLVVGTGENGLAHPGWQENFRLALALQSAVERVYPTLCRPIHLCPERYNQQLTSGSLLLEVGTNGNTLSEALRAAELFALAAGPVLLSLVEV